MKAKLGVLTLAQHELDLEWVGPGKDGICITNSQIF